MAKDTRIELSEERVREIVREELKKIKGEKRERVKALKPKGTFFP